MSHVRGEIGQVFLSFLGLRVRFDQVFIFECVGALVKHRTVLEDNAAATSWTSFFFEFFCLAHI